MTQASFGVADAFVGNWVNRTLNDILDEVITTVNLFESISGEGDNDDEAFARTENNPPNSPYVMQIDGLIDPGVDVDHNLKYRVRSEAAVGEQIDLTVELRQDYVSEASPGILIDSEIQVDIPTVFTDFTLAISDPSLITDYDSLYIRFVANII